MLVYKNEISEIVEGKGWFLTEIRREAVAELYGAYLKRLEEVKKRNEDVKKLNEHLNKLVNAPKKDAELIKTLQAEIASLKTNIESLKAELAVVTQEGNEEYTAHSDLLAVLAERDILVKSQEDTLDTLKKEILELRKEVGVAEKKAEDNQQSFQRISEELFREREERANLADAFLELQREVAKKDKELEDADKNSLEVAERVVTAEGKYNKLKADVEVAIAHLTNTVAE